MLSSSENAIAQYQLEVENIKPTYLIMVMYLSENNLVFFLQSQKSTP